MTADQKRVHLALHGCSAWRMKIIDEHPINWRIMGQAHHTRRNLQPTPDLISWKLGDSTTPNRYEPHDFSEIPDELLDRLSETLIERFITIYATTH